MIQTFDMLMSCSLAMFKNAVTALAGMHWETGRGAPTPALANGGPGRSAVYPICGTQATCLPVRAACLTIFKAGTCGATGTRATTGAPQSVPPHSFTTGKRRLRPPPVSLLLDVPQSWARRHRRTLEASQIWRLQCVGSLEPISSMSDTPQGHGTVSVERSL